MIESYGQKTYKKPQTKILPLSPEAMDYLTQVRKLSRETIETYRLGCNERGEIVIPFYDEKENLVLVKRRHQRGLMIERKFKNDAGDWESYEVKTDCERDGKPVLLGSHTCLPSEGPLVVFFGDYDAMSANQDGIPNCVSLPFGDKGFGFFDTQWDFINQFSEIVLFPDNDKFPTKEKEIIAQKKLDELATRFGKHRVKLVRREDYQGAKDANELYVKKGKDSCKNAILNADWFPTGIVKVANYVEPEMEEGTPIGMTDVDRSTGGLGSGQLILLAGDNGAGKTTAACNITTEFIERGLPVLWWSGEQRVGKIRYWMERILAGPDNLKKVTGRETGFEYYYPLDEDRPVMRAWYENYLYQITNFAITPEEFFADGELAIKRYGCRLIVIDNLMAFTGGEGDGYYQAQGDFIQSCKMFGEKMGVPVLVMVHNKKEKEGQLPNKDSIEGSKKITNWADVIMQMYRVPEVDKHLWGNADTILRLCKSRESGKIEDIRLLFESTSNRFCQMSEEWKIRRQYGWQKPFLKEGVEYSSSYKQVGN